MRKKVWRWKQACRSRDRNEVLARGEFTPPQERGRLFLTAFLRSFATLSAMQRGR